MFQHGLGGDVSQPFGLYTPPDGIRLIGMDCRAHGATRPLGDPSLVSIASFTDDLIALINHLDISRVVVGGTSMGAAVALNFALRYPNRVVGVIVSRPAWIDRPLPENARPIAHVAQYLLKYGATEGLQRYKESPEYARMFMECPDTAAALEQQFLDPRAEECVVRLERIPHDAPAHEREEFTTIHVPALVLGCRHDPVHPWECASTLASLLPRAKLVELTPKSVSLQQHVAEFQAVVDDFLNHLRLTGDDRVSHDRRTKRHFGASRPTIFLSPCRFLDCDHV